ncbi:MAG: hypothetical protein JW720_07420 [Sedimentisphaerales bacterium]|nr:hypothetical protein [Sedimentisphaerales bacterium]
MKKILIVLLIVSALGCGPQLRPLEDFVRRQDYVAANIENIRQTNRALLVRKTEDMLTWRPRIASIAERKKELVDVIIRAMCGEDTHVLTKELMAFAPKADRNAEAASELEAGLYALSRVADPNICRICEDAILAGRIVEGMNLDQVEAALGIELRPLSADSSGNSVFEVCGLAQENFILKQGRIAIAATTPSAGGELRNFYLHFAGDVLVDWLSVPEVDARGD